MINQKLNIPATENRVALSDQIQNIDYVIDFIINPAKITQVNEIICFFIVYDITVEQSLIKVFEQFIKNYQHNINRQFQFTLLIGNKADLEEYREIQSDTAQTLANQHQLIFLEVSANTGKNIDYLQKMLRIKSSQMLKKINIQPSIQEPFKIFQIQEHPSKESNEANSYQNDSLEEDQSSPSLQSSLSSQNAYQSPPSLPPRSEVQTPSKDQYCQTDISSEIFQKIEFLESHTKRSLPEEPLTSTKKIPNNDNFHSKSKDTSTKKQNNIISDLCSRPSPVRTNLNAKFNRSIGSKSSPSRAQAKQNNRVLLQQDNTKLSQYKSLDFIDKSVKDIEIELQHLNSLIVKKQNITYDEINFGEIEQHRHFIKEDDSYVPVVDAFLYQDIENKHKRLKLTIPQGPSITLQSDPRIYSKRLKPLILIAIQLNDDITIIDVYNEDTPSIIAERSMIKMGKKNSSKKQLKYMRQIIEAHIFEFSRELERLIEYLDRKNLKKRDGIESYLTHRNQQVQNQLDQRNIKNNWMNSNQAIGKIVVCLEGDKTVKLYVHQKDDPYELAFYFLLENGLKKNKINILVQQILQMQKQLSNVKPIVYPTTRPNTEQRFIDSSLFYFRNDIIFQGNFDCGNGLIIPVLIKTTDDVERTIFQIVQEHRLKYEQFLKILQIVKQLN